MKIISGSTLEDHQGQPDLRVMIDKIIECAITTDQEDIGKAFK